jgi:hypothetical protein
MEEEEDEDGSQLKEDGTEVNVEVIVVAKDSLDGKMIDKTMQAVLSLLEAILSLRIRTNLLERDLSLIMKCLIDCWWQSRTRGVTNWQHAVMIATIDQ